MRIIADKDLYKAKALFSDLGDLTLIPGREIRSHHLSGADALIVRSTTVVSEQLLKNTSLKFIGSATSGIDHINLDLLNDKNINFASARGCNANAVSEYCMADFSAVRREEWSSNPKPKVGIIGNGMVGNELIQKFKSLNCEVLVNDPPKSVNSKEAVDGLSYYSLEELTQCNIISVHVPLIYSGEYSTRNLIGKEFLLSLPKKTMFINTSRGEVIDEEVLLEVMKEREDLIFILDVWRDEPQCNRSLVKLANIATPHIAGYSEEAKKKASLKMMSSLINFFELPIVSSKVYNSEISKPLILNSAESYVDAIAKVFPIREISARFKQSLFAREDVNEKESFDKLRRQLSKRKEFCNYLVPESFSEESIRFLTAVGFRN